jgi:hypothetical protein
VSAVEGFAQIRMYFIDLLQHDYEVVRPIVLFGVTTAERSRQTGIDRTVIGDKARRFITDGMIGLTDGRTQPRPSDGPIYPEALAGYIIYLKQRYPPIRLCEIEHILLRKFGYQTNRDCGAQVLLVHFGWIRTLLLAHGFSSEQMVDRVAASACLARGSPRPVRGQGQAGSRC